MPHLGSRLSLLSLSLVLAAQCVKALLSLHHRGCVLPILLAETFSLKGFFNLHFEPLFGRASGLLLGGALALALLLAWGCGLWWSSIALQEQTHISQTAVEPLSRSSLGQQLARMHASANGQGTQFEESRRRTMMVNMGFEQRQLQDGDAQLSSHA